ncbi:hypothetical protein [[Mycobacterium] burgundiense]|uniref:Uncharacterized protein n=1 Tax=[Mycobacterium] burgundiense TaxID=3064286 RepID=A0ABM9L824_9MYCO|nr:hypothetical protein [Mycolicibacterium sp. MU0053]CAJ1494413.1 hypothetical protein MU0053_000034 [Mycolicibacterium sp. MU0053]
MASIAGLRSWPRWSRSWLLQLLRPPDSPTLEEIATPAARREKRFYQPQRDAFIENAAMAREMYRL